jgi:glycosyltransferase 2 family protein
VKLDWRGAVGIALSVALLWWVFHRIPYHEVWGTLRTANLPLIALAAAVSTSCFPIRARRWRPILDPIALNVPFGPLWRATAIGMMVNNVVPARAGELARAFALTREVPRVPLSASVASLAVDRLFDALVVLLLLVTAMLLPGFPRGAAVAGISAGRAALGAGVLIIVLLAVLYAIVFFPGWLIRAYEALARRVAPGLEARGRAALVHFSAGLSVLRSPRRFAIVFLWALLFWLVNAVGFYIVFLAVGIQVPFTAALFLQGLIAVGVAVPAAPGFFGVFEAFGVIGLAFYHIPQAQAVAWAIAYHLASFIPITLIGAWYFVRLGLHLRDVATADTQESAAA